jgi:hypothetical protein
MADCPNMETTGRRPPRAVLASELEVTEQSTLIDGKSYPWYLSPFGLRVDGAIIVYDPFPEQRKLFDKWTDNRDSARSMAKAAIATDKMDAAAEEMFHQLCCLNPAFAAHKTGYIRDKSAKLVRFDHWNSLQRELFFEFSARWYNKKPVRILILKARQEGASTWSEYIIFWLAAFHEQKECYILAHKDKSSKKIYAMTERFFNNLKKSLPMHRIPQRQNHSGWQLSFGESRRSFQESSGKEKARREKREDEDGLERLGQGPVLESGVEVMTAGGKDADRGFTASALHGSEVAFWSDPEEGWVAIAQGVPDSEESIVILESTANCAGDFWNAKWDAAVSGKGDYRPVFSGWLAFPYRWNSSTGEYEREYSRELPRSYQSDEGRDRYAAAMNKEEQHIVAEFGATLEQIEWRRFAIVDKCNGDLEKFKREYPICAAEAFRATGTNIFERESVDYYMEFTDPRRHPAPKFVGNFDLERTRDGETKTVKLIEASDGHTKIWVMPVPGRTYVVSADSAEGENITADHCSSSVIDVQTLEQCAHCWNPCGTFNHALQVHCLASIYGDALVVPEVTGLGYKMVHHLTPLGEFPVEHLYVREEVLNTNNMMTKKYGFSTNKKTKPYMVGKLQQMVNARLATIHSHETAKQLRGYVCRGDGSWGKARKSDSDDAVDDLSLGMVGIDSGQVFFNAQIPGHRLGPPLPQLRQMEAEGRAPWQEDHAVPMDGTFDPVLGECL